MVGFFKPGLFLAAIGAVAVGVWIIVYGGPDAFGFPFDLPGWMLIAGKNVAVGGIAILAGVAVGAIALIVQTSDYEKRNPPGGSQINPGD